MPELPEVQTIVNQLTSVLASVTIEDIQILRQKNVTGNKEIVVNQNIRSVSRVGKYIVLSLSNEKFIVIHLRMTGQLLWSEKEINNPYIRAVIKTNKGILMFRDIRTFGRINILPSLQELKNLTIHIGVDALKELTNTRLHNILKNAHTNIKSLLLNQQKISGLGNIYANEALFKSHIHPLKQASSITKSECNLLHQVIKETLENAIHHGGTSFSDFRGIHNEKGQYQHKNLVYQKENHPCSVCKTKIQRIIIQQRSSFYCPLCQKLDS